MPNRQPPTTVRLLCPRQLRSADLDLLRPLLAMVVPSGSPACQQQLSTVLSKLHVASVVILDIFDTERGADSGSAHFNLFAPFRRNSLKISIRPGVQRVATVFKEPIASPLPSPARASVVGPSFRAISSQWIV